MTQEDKQNLWHSIDEEPKFPSNTYEPLCSILVLYDNGNMFLYRYNEGGRPNDMFTPPFSCIENAKWCYCNDLIP